MINLDTAMPLQLFALNCEEIIPKLEEELEPAGPDDVVVGVLNEDERRLYTLLSKFGMAARTFGEQEKEKALRMVVDAFFSGAEEPPMEALCISPYFQRLTKFHEMLHLMFWNQVRERFGLWEYGNVRICPDWQIAVVPKKDCGCGKGPECGAVKAGLLKPEVVPPAGSRSGN